MCYFQEPTCGSNYDDFVIAVLSNIKQNKRFVQECFSSADNIQKHLVLLEIESFIIYDCHNFVGSLPFVILTILNNNYYSL